MKPGASPISPPLRRLFLAIARASIASSGGACAAEHPLTDPQDDGANWTSVSCAQYAPAYATGLRASRETDSVYVYEEGEKQTHYVVPLLQVEEACAGVADRAACEQRITSLESASACPQLPCHFAIAGRGGEYERIDRREQLLALLGSIDTVAEALVLAAFDGHALCPGIEVDPRDIGAEVRATPGGYELRISRQDCEGELYREELAVAPDGTLAVISRTVLGPSRCIGGRRPDGWRASDPSGGSTPIGAFLAKVAQLEAASVYAFHKLLRELRALGAPEVLRRAALDAMLDEVRHASELSELARAYGGEVAKPEVQRTDLRSAYEMALDNIGEGCVRETFGALQATYQAETAADPRVRRVMAQVAEDESRHAELAWQLQAWLESQLSAAELANVQTERKHVLDELAADLGVGLSHEEHTLLGLPTPAVAATMLAGLSRALFA